MEGEREKTIYGCMPYLNQLSFFFLVFLSFLFCFLSYLFSFFLLCFLFFTQENILCFSIPFIGHDKSLFIVPAVTMVLPFCLLTASVWSGRTCRPPEVCATHPCQTEAGFSSPPDVALLSCHGINAFSLYSQSMHQRFPLKLTSFGRFVIPAGRTSRKRLGQEP